MERTTMIGASPIARGVRPALPSAILLLALLAACAVRLGGPSPEPYRVLAVPAAADESPGAVAERIRSEEAELVLVSAERDSAWFSELASAVGLGLSGPGRTGPRGMAFLTGLELLGDTSIILQLESGERIHMHDALYEIGEDRQLDLMMVDFDAVTNLREGVRTLLMYIATDVGNNVPLVMGVSAATTAADDSVAVLLRAAFASASDCAEAGSDGGNDGPAVDGLQLLYGPPARMQCESARALPGDSGISARLIVGR
jgi:hypothetical protein